MNEGENGYLPNRERGGPAQPGQGGDTKLPEWQGWGVVTASTCLSGPLAATVSLSWLLGEPCSVLCPGALPVVPSNFPLGGLGTPTCACARLLGVCEEGMVGARSPGLKREG